MKTEKQCLAVPCVFATGKSNYQAVSHVASLVGVSADTIRRYVKIGELSAMYVEKRLFVNLDECTAWFQKLAEAGKIKVRVLPERCRMVVPRKDVPSFLGERRTNETNLFVTTLDEHYKQVSRMKALERDMCVRHKCDFRIKDNKSIVIRQKNQKIKDLENELSALLRENSSLQSKLKETVHQLHTTQANWDSLKVDIGRKGRIHFSTVQVNENDISDTKEVSVPTQAPDSQDSPV